MKRSRPVLALALLLLVASTSPTAAQPSVTKVEPPSWWPGHSWNPVRVLVRGSALQGARGVLAVDLDVFHLKDFDDLSATELAVRATTAAPLQAHVRIFPARPTPDDPTLIDRYAKDVRAG